MASRFWAGGGSDSESASDDDDSSDDYSQAEDRGGQNRWADLSDESESDDEVRVVKSGRERAVETFNKHISAIRSAMKSRDYFTIQTEFDELAKAMIKAKKVLAEGVPRSLVRILVELEDYVPERLADKESFKQLSARQGRALNRMKLTLNKHNKPFQLVMNEYRKNPVTEDDEDESEDEDDDDDSGSDSDSDSSSSSSEDDDDAKKKKKKPGMSSSVRCCFCLSLLLVLWMSMRITRMPYQPLSFFMKLWG